MSGEIRLQALTGRTNVKGPIYDKNGLVWDGASSVDVDTLTDAEWVATMVACPEKLTSDGTGTGLYLGDKPAGLPDDIYSVVFYDDVTPSPDDPYIGTQDDFLEYLTDRTGFKLASDGLDLVTAWTTDITGSLSGSVGSVAGNIGGNVVGSVASVTAKTGYALASSGLDAVLIDGKTLPAALQIIGAVVAGEITTAGEVVEIFLGLDGVTTRVSVTVDTEGNRSNVADS